VWGAPGGSNACIGDALRLRQAEENIDVLVSLLGSNDADAIMRGVVDLARLHRGADEFALMAELFGYFSLRQGEHEASDARWASLRRRPHWTRGER
jgi:hypothetical protein